MRIFERLRGLRRVRRSSFSMSVESSDIDLRSRANVYYEWSFDPSSALSRPLNPDALARYNLRELIIRVSRRYRLLEVSSAEDAINAMLSNEVSDDDARIRIKGRVRLRVSKNDLRESRRRLREEASIRSAFALEAVRLNLTATRLADPVLGPAWWVDRYADIQFAAGDPSVKVKSALVAFEAIRESLNAAIVDSVEDPRLRVRRKIDELFDVIQDPQAFALALDLINRFFEKVNMESSVGARVDAQRRDE